MTEQPSGSLFSKLTWQSVFMIGIVLTMLIVEMDMSVGGVAASSFTDAQSFRAGTANIITTLGGQSYGPIPVTFTTPLPGPPADIKLTLVGGSPGTSVGAAGFTFLDIPAQVAGDGVWTSMPAAKTEIFAPGSTSTACCRLSSTITGLANGCVLSVNTIVVSNTIGASLNVQWASSAAGPWTDIAGSSVDVHGIVANPHVSNAFGVSINGAVGFIFLRIVGSGGGGIGDNPQFSLIEMTCAMFASGVTLSWLNPTATGFNLFASLAAPDATGGNTIVASYQAFLCTGGGQC